MHMIRVRPGQTSSAVVRSHVSLRMRESERSGLRGPILLSGECTLCLRVRVTELCRVCCSCAVPRASLLPLSLPLFPADSPLRRPLPLPSLRPRSSGGPTPCSPSTSPPSLRRRSQPAPCANDGRRPFAPWSLTVQHILAAEAACTPTSASAQLELQERVWTTFIKDRIAQMYPWISSIATRTAN